MAIETPIDLFQQILARSQADHPTLRDFTRDPSAQRLEQFNAERVVIEGQIGIGRLSSNDVSKLVAVSQPGDAALDDAYARFLSAHPEIAKETVAPQVFANLDRTGAALSSVDAAVGPLRAAVYDAMQDHDTENERLNRLVLDLLSLPPATVLAPGVTVADAQFYLADFVREHQLQTSQEEGRAKRAASKARRLDTQVATAQAQLAQEQTVNELRRFAHGGGAAKDLPAAAASSRQRAGDKTHGGE